MPSPTSIINSIAQLEKDLRDTNALERLNSDELDDEDRLKIGLQLQELTRLRAADIADELTELTNAVTHLEAEQTKRLHAYGVLP